MSLEKYYIPRALHRHVHHEGVRKLEQTHNAKLIFPRREDPSCEILISGDGASDAKAAIEAILGFELSREPLQTRTLDLDHSLFGRIIGHHGATIKKLTKDFHSSVELAQKEDKERNRVVLQGPPSKLDDLQDEIENITGEKANVVKSDGTVVEGFEKLNLEGDIREALFFDNNNNDACHDVFLNYLRSTKKTLVIAVFNLTDDRIVRVLKTLFAHGVKIRIVTDDDQSKSQGSDIEELKGLGIGVRMDDGPAHMHHKFAILDDQVLINGSFNWTRGAATENCENMMITSEQVFVDKYSKEFERLWKMFDRQG
eukprot:m.267210 g.267210  ORF g.267210 m.267210 type:complete len:313 (-) comp32538_c0_seq1:141-1079(-)